MNARSLPATEVKNRFGRVLREIAKSGGPIIVERGGKPVAVIMSIREYERSRRHRRLSRGEQDILRSAFGMWAQRKDIDDEWVAAGRVRWTSDWGDGESG